MIKINLISVFIFIGSLLISCSNDDDSNSKNDKNNFSTINELETAIDTLYINVAIATRMNTFFVSAFAGDDITTTAFSAKWDYRAIDSRNQLNGNARAEQVWRDAYKIITEANTILSQSKSLETTNLAYKNRLIGEVHFIRGFIYHHLTRMFGKLPIQQEPEINIDLAFSEISDVYKFIESDWLTAEQLLPNLYPSIDAGASRPNNGSAQAFLARLYLDWAGFPIRDNSKYNLSATYAKKVIDNHASHGFDLLEDFDDLWTLEHRFNKESIFTIIHCNSCPQGGNFKTGTIGFPSELGGWAETFGEIKFFETFPDNHRKKATYITDIKVDDPFSNPSGGATINWTNLIQPNPLFAKIVGKGDFPRNSHENDRNDYIMRYAEVLLTYSEASARAGSSSADAWEALNKVRRRAELLPPNVPNVTVDLTSGNLAELAYTERGWELAGEFLRWFDLIRMERVATFLDNSYRNNVTSTVTDKTKSNFGEIVQEIVPIDGSTASDNYFIPIGANYKIWYPTNN